jgi:hypothetical protein
VQSCNQQTSAVAKEAVGSSEGYGISEIWDPVSLVVLGVGRIVSG